MVDFNLNPGDAIITSDIDIVLQQIDLLFDTTPREVIGDEKYGSTYDEYLYRLKISAENLKNKVVSDLQQLDLRGYLLLAKKYVSIFLSIPKKKPIL